MLYLYFSSSTNSNNSLTTTTIHAYALYTTRICQSNRSSNNGQH